MPTSSKPRAKTSPAASRTRAKVEHPAKEFSRPQDVVADPALSTNEKLRALNTLEQDARQLAVATEEGMSGGEETQLRPVLQAKRSLEYPSVDAAFAVVSRTFEEQLRETRGMEAHTLIVRAIDAIKAARDAMANRAGSMVSPPGAPEPGSAQEMREEIEKEKLDPGG
jgi:hypothetical protein